MFPIALILDLKFVVIEVTVVVGDINISEKMGFVWVLGCGCVWWAAEFGLKVEFSGGEFYCQYLRWWSMGHGVAITISNRECLSSVGHLHVASGPDQGRKGGRDLTEWQCDSFRLGKGLNHNFSTFRTCIIIIIVGIDITTLDKWSHLETIKPPHLLSLTDKECHVIIISQHWIKAIFTFSFSSLCEWF